MKASELTPLRRPPQDSSRGSSNRVVGIEVRSPMAPVAVYTPVVDGRADQHQHQHQQQQPREKRRRQLLATGGALAALSVFLVSFCLPSPEGGGRGGACAGGAGGAWRSWHPSDGVAAFAGHA